DGALLQHHDITATYVPDAASGLFSSSISASMRVRRATTVRVRTTDCATWSLPVGESTICSPQVLDLDTDAGVLPAPEGTIVWTPAATAGLGFSTSSCHVTIAAPLCPVGLTPTLGQSYSWFVNFIPDATDVYHSAGFAMGGHLDIVSADVTQISNINCPPTAPIGTTVTCTVDISNTTGSRPPNGTLNWLFYPVYSVTGGACVSITSNEIQCSATVTAAAPAGPVQLQVIFTAA